MVVVRVFLDTGHLLSLLIQLYNWYEVSMNAFVLPFLPPSLNLCIEKLLGLYTRKTNIIITLLHRKCSFTRVLQLRLFRSTGRRQQWGYSIDRTGLSVIRGFMSDHTPISQREGGAERTNDKQVTCSAIDPREKTPKSVAVQKR